MSKKNLILYTIILVLVVLFLWQWLSKGALINQSSQLDKSNKQLAMLSGIGPLGSTHKHADVKVYINGKAIDFSQHKYQVTTSYIHFEDGLGDVIHTHATGLNLGHLFKSVGGDLTNNCLVFESQSYCNNGDKTLKLYVNGQPSNEFGSKVINDLDKYLISYGGEDGESIKKQLDSVTNLAPKYSLQG